MLTGVTFISIIILGLLPIVFYFSLKKIGVYYRLSTYYSVEGIIFLLVMIGGHFYYYMFYDLRLLPSIGHLKFFTGASVITVVAVFVIGPLIEKMRKGQADWPSLRAIVITLCIFIIFFNAVVPLGYKYYYAKRLDVAKELFQGNDPKNVAEDGDIMVAFAGSAKDPMLRARYRARSYHNYFHIKNSGHTTFHGDLFLLLYDEKGELFSYKSIEDVTVEPNESKLLIENLNPISSDIWNENTFTTNNKVKSFDAEIEERAS